MTSFKTTSRSSPRRTGAHLLALVLVLQLVGPGALFAATDSAEAGSALPMSATLPTGRWGTSAVWDGTHAYIFGGTDGTLLDEIVRYDPATDNATVMGATLPTGRHLSSAVWDGTHAYIFGGFDGGTSRLDEIVRYDPATDTATVMSATLPTGRQVTSAVWDGTHAYIFSPLDEIVRYDPATDTVTVMSATLPTARYWTSAVWDGTHAYIFGGTDGTSHSDEIVRYDPVTDTVAVMSATLPTGRYGSSALWDGTNAYIFGGHDGTHLDEIVRYDPATDSTTVMSATLPTGRMYTSAVWDGTNAYIFGGYDGAGFDGIVQYDPSADSVAVMSATLPTARHRTSAVWDGTHAYIFGGLDGTRLDEIVRYDPATDSVAVMSATLPTGRYVTSAVWDGTHAYIFGGADSTHLDEIVRYDPTTDTITTLSATLPTGRTGTSAVWDGTHAYIFGGWDGNTRLDEIVRYDPATDSVAVMSATLPTGRIGMGAMWDGTHAYIFGGRDDTSRLDEIVRYDPATDSVTFMNAILPTERSRTSAVWDGTHAYTFGGNDGTFLDEIVQYTPPDCRDPGPDLYGYVCRVKEGVFTDIEATGNQMILGDDQTLGPFDLTDGGTYDPFLYHGKAYTSFTVSSNGFLILGDDTHPGCCDGQVLPDPAAPNGVIAGYWTDLHPLSSGAVHREFVPGLNAMIVQFSGVAISGDHTATFQIQLDLITHEVSVVFGPTAGHPDFVAVTGIENHDGTSGLTYKHGAFHSPGDGRLSDGDAIYLNLDLGSSDFEIVELGDVRIAHTGGASSGAQVISPSADLGFGLVTDVSTRLCYFDSNGNVFLDTGEPLYVKVNGAECAQVKAGDLRLSAVGGLAAGSLVAAGDSDLLNPISVVDNNRIVFRDNDLDSVYGIGDDVYLKLAGDGLGTDVEVGDYRLTAGGAGAAFSWVTSGDTDINEPLLLFPADPHIDDPHVLAYHDAQYRGILFEPPAPYLPSAPSIVGGGMTDDNVFTMDWAVPEDNGMSHLESYWVYRGETEPTLSKFDQVTTTSFTDSSAEPGETWVYAVSAVNGVGEGSLGSAITVEFNDVPSAPGDLTSVVGPGADEITLDWQAAEVGDDPPVTAYHVYRGSSSLSLSKIATLDSTTTSFTDAGISQWDTWFYAVTAENSVGESEQSNIVFDMIPGSSSLLAWGLNDHGRLGDNTTTHRESPVQVVGPAGTGFLQDVVDISGQHHTLAAKSDGTAWAWGLNLQSQLGDGTTIERRTPVQVVGPGGSGFLDNVVHVSAGGSHSLALKQDGTVWAWGTNTFGKLGDNSTTDSPTPVQVLGPDGAGFLTDIIQVAAGASHSVALRSDGTVWTWGGNGAGQLGDGSCCSALTPVQVKGLAGDGFLENVIQVSTFSSHNLAVLDDGTLWAWGRNLEGQLGDGTTTSRDTPVQVVGPDGVGHLTDMVRASSSFLSSHAFKSDGTVWSWGNNSFGRLGDGTTTDRVTPVQVAGPDGTGFLSDIIELSAGVTHVQALRSDDTLWAWGNGDFGSLGDGLDTTSHTPVQVLEPDGTDPLDNVVGIAAGRGSSFAIRSLLPPDHPDGLVADPGVGTINLGWSPPVDSGGDPITQYHVYGSDTEGGPYGLLASVDASTLAFTETGLGDGATRCYVVIAENGVGESLPSEEACATTFDVPGEPLNALATGSHSVIFVSWNPPLDDGGTPITGYNVYVSDDFGDSYSLVGEVESTGFNHTGLDNGITLCYIVAAVNEVGEGPTSAISCATTFDVPSPPQNLAANAGPDPGAVNLSWEPPADDGGSPVSSYIVYRDGVNVTSVTDSSFTDTGLANGATHTYHVTAVNEVGESAASNSADVTTWDVPSPPLNLTAEAGPGAGEITVTWTPPVDDGGTEITHYPVYVSETPGGPYDPQGALLFGLTSFKMTGLEPGETRCIVLSAENDVGESEVSNEDCATTFDVPSAPTAFDATTGAVAGTIDILWAPPLDDGGLPVTGYKVYGADDSADPFDLLATVSSNQTTFTESGLGDSVARIYQVATLTDAGEGERTEPFGSTTLQPEDTPPLPEGTSATSATWQGHYVYIFGGRSEDGNDTDAIVRFHPEDNEIVTLNLTLPSPRLGTSATWIPGAFPQASSDPSLNACDPNCPSGRNLIFGGLSLPGTPGQQDVGPQDCHGSCPAGRQIVFFEPGTDTVGFSDATFDEGRFGTSAVFVPDDDGTEAHDEPGTQDCHGSCPAGRSFIFGGFPINPPGQQSIEPLDCHGSCPVGRQIMEYDPVDDTLTPHDDTLPVPLGGTSAVWDPLNQVAYIFGGRHTDEVQSADCHGSCPGWIIEFDPHAQVTTSSVTVLPAELPSPRWNTSAFFDGQFAYIMGGENETGFIDEIVRFDPATHAVDIVGTLPTKRTQTSTAFDGQHAYVIGGLEQGNVSTDEIVKYTPTAPQQAQAQAGPGVGQVTVSWQAPSNDGGSNLTSYRLYRSMGDDLWDRIAVLDINDTQYVDGGLGNGSAVAYRVSAVNLIGEGPQGDTVQTVTFDVPGAPAGLSGGPSGLGEIEISWNPPDDMGTPITAYQVYGADNAAGPFVTIGTTPGTTTTFTETGLDPLDIRHYRVSAQNLVGEGNQSDTLTLTTFDPLNIYVVENGPITIQEAAQFLAPGGTIWLGPGVYEEEVTLPVNATIQPGTASNVTVLSEPDPVVIEGGIHVSGADWVEVRDIEINATEGGTLQGIAFRSLGVDRVDLRNLTVRGDGAPAGEGFFRGIIDVRGASELVVVDNQIGGDPDAGGFSSGIRVQPAPSGAPSFQVERNRITSIKGAGITVTGANQATQAVIRDNSVSGGLRGLLLYESRHDSLRIEDNTLASADIDIQVLGDHVGQSVFRYNRITGNDLGFATGPDTLGLDVRHNWWGQATGPLVGQELNLEPADYAPWCVQADCNMDRDATDPLLP